MDDKLNEVTKSGWIIKDTRSGHYVGNRHGSMSIPHKDKAHVFSSEDEAHELSSKFFGNHEVIRHSISEPKKLDKTITNKLSSIRDQLKGLKEETDLNEVVLNVAQRIKRGQTMRRNKSKLKRGREIAATRPANAEHIKRRAMDQARDIVRTRYAGKYGAEYVDLSTSQKIAIDRAIDGKQKLIKKLALRLIPRVKQADMAKLAHGHHVAESLEENKTSDMHVLKKHLGFVHVGDGRKGYEHLNEPDSAKLEPPDNHPYHKLTYDNKKSHIHKALKKAGYKQEDGNTEHEHGHYSYWNKGHNSVQVSIPHKEDPKTHGLTSVHHENFKEPHNSKPDVYFNAKKAGYKENGHDIWERLKGHKPIKENLESNPLNIIFAEAFKKKKVEAEQKGDSPNVNLLNRFDNKVSSALTKKAEKSGCTVETLVKVYARGLKSWNESSNMSPEQYAFGRVNSFINGGKAIQEDLDLHEARIKKPWSGMPSGAADVTRGTHSHFIRIYKREPTRDELKKALKDRSENDAVGWHQKHAGIAYKHLNEDLDLHEAETPGRKPKATERFARKHEKTTDEYGSELYTHKDGRSGYVVGHDRKKPGHVLLRVLKTTGVRHSKTEQYEDHSVHGNDLRVSKSGDTGPAKGNLKLKVNKPSGENQYKKNQRVYLKKEFGPNAPDSGTVHAENDTHVLVNVFGRGKLKVAKEHVSHDPAHKWNAKKVSESLDEGKMKELAADLRDMDHGNFKKKYGKSREQLSHELNGKPKPIQEISDITKASYKDKAKTQLGAEKLFYDKEHHAKLKSTLGSNDPVVKHMDKQSNTIRKRETGLKKVQEGISIGNSVDVDPGKKGGPTYDAIALSSKGSKLKAKTTAGYVVTAPKDQVKPDPIADQAALKRKQLIKNKILETVKTGDKEPVVIPSYKDEYGNTIAAKTVMRKRNKKILGAGNVHDGEGN